VEQVVFLAAIDKMPCRILSSITAKHSIEKISTFCIQAENHIVDGVIIFW
jgi:hypothetical protein